MAAGTVAATVTRSIRTPSPSVASTLRPSSRNSLSGTSTVASAASPVKNTRNGADGSETVSAAVSLPPPHPATSRTISTVALRPPATATAMPNSPPHQAARTMATTLTGAQRAATAVSPQMATATAGDLLLKNQVETAATRPATRLDDTTSQLDTSTTPASMLRPEVGAKACRRKPSTTTAVGLAPAETRGDPADVDATSDEPSSRSSHPTWACSSCWCRTGTWAIRSPGGSPTCQSRSSTGRSITPAIGSTLHACPQPGINGRAEARA